MKPQGSECECMNGCKRFFTSESAFDAHFVSLTECGNVPKMVHKSGKNKGLPLFRQIQRRGGIFWTVNRPDLPDKSETFRDSKSE